MQREIRRRVEKGYRMGSVPADDATFVRLMRAAQAGDTDAYGELLNAITPLLRRLVRRRRTFLGADEVEDLVQDILLSVHSVRATYDSARPFTPWLLTIARNRLADSARRFARTSSREVVVD